MGNGDWKRRKWLARRDWVATVRGLADRDERNRHTGGVPRAVAMMEKCPIWAALRVERVAAVRRLANRGKDNSADQSVSRIQQPCHSRRVQVSYIWSLMRSAEIARNKTPALPGLR